MKDIHHKLKKTFPWYERWHSHPRHQHAHWFGVFSFLLLTASFISAQLVVLYSEKMEAQAQTALPAPNHQMTLGYYYAVGQYGNFLSEVSGYNNSQIIIAGSWIRGGAECDTAALDSAFSSTIAAGQRIIYIPIGPDATTCNSGSSTYDTAMNVARNYWNNIDILYIADEPVWDQATTQNYITTFENAVAGSGLSTKPIMINYTRDQIMTGTSFLATNLDIVSFEAYADFSRQNETNLASNLLNEVNQAKARIGNRQMMLVVQGYARNFCPAAPTYCWSNLTSLQSIQTTAYLAAAGDPNVIGLTIFSYGRASGTREIGDCLKNEHRKIWGAITGTNQPASVSCGGSGGGGAIQWATPLTSWNPTQTNDGWWAELSPDGRYVTYGNGQTWITDLQTNIERNITPASETRCWAGHWIQPTTITFVCEISDNGPMRRYEASLASNWNPVPTADDTNLVKAGSFKASDGHWASYLALTHLVKDNQVIDTNPGALPPSGAFKGLSGSLMVAACDPPEWRTICVYDGNQLVNTFNTPFEWIGLDIINSNFISYGDWTQTRGICLSDGGNINLRAGPPSQAEGLMSTFMNGSTPWVVSNIQAGATEYMLMRPWGERQSIALDTRDAIVASVVKIPGAFKIAYHNNVGRLTVITIADTSPRSDLSGGLAPETCGGIAPPEVGGTGPTDATPGWEGGLAYNPTANNWLVVSGPRDDKIYGRIMGDDAQPVGNFFQINVNVNPGGAQTLAPKVAYDTDLNRYFVIWVDFSTDTNGKIIGQFIDSTGTLIGSNFEIPRDFTGDVMLGSNSPMRYDSVNKRFVYVWETRDPNIHSNLRTINSDGTANPTIRVTEEIGAFQTAPVVAINPSANEYCVAYGYCGPNSVPTCDQQRGNIGVRRVDAVTGQLGPTTYGDVESWGGPNISYNSVDNNYLIAFDNNGDKKGAIYSSCDTSSAGPIFTAGRRFGTTVTTYNSNANTFAMIGQDQDSYTNLFVILDGTGNVLASKYLFPNIANGHFAPSVAANTNTGTYSVISSYNFAQTKFISRLGLGITGGTPIILTPTPCDPGVIQPGIPVICDFTPTIARPGDAINIAGGNLSSTVQMFSLSGSRYTVLGTVDTTGENVNFFIPTDVPEGDYTLRVIGSDNVTFASSNKIINVTLNLPAGVGATGEDTPFGPTAGITPPGSTMTFQDLISNSLSYAVYAVGVAVFMMILYAGFLWITSAANPGNIAVAKRYITNAVIGAVLLLSSYIILYTINPDLVGGSLTLPTITGSGGPSGVSTIVQPTCDNGVCSNSTGNTCTQNTDCNAVCISNICNNGAIGTCTLDTDCQLFPRFIADTEAKAAMAFSAGCSRLNGVGYQDFMAVECQGSVPLTLDPVFQLQDSGANQQVGAAVTQTGGNNGAGRKIVVLDTGYNYSHPELSSSYGGGRDFINNDNDPMDDHTGGIGSPGHGSHVAGIITADGIDGQAKGIAPQAQIIAGKVLDARGQGEFSKIVTAIYWAVNGPDNVFGTTDDFKADAINLSVGGGAYPGLCDNNDANSQNMARAINYARDHGVIVVVAAGNKNTGVSMPGCIGSSFTVGAVDSSDTVAGFSGRGSGVDIVAPGVNIYSTILGGNLGNKSGTSMATPMVAGLIALIKSAFPNYTADQVEKAITDTSIDLGTLGKDTTFGHGRISATAAGNSSAACTGTCGTLVASPASCTKGMTASNPNCNINLIYTSRGISPSILTVEKNGVKIQTPTTGSGNVIDSNPTAGIYVYSLENVNTGQIISSTTVHVYYTGALTSPWLSCTKNADPANPNCDIALNYNITGNVNGNGFIYKDGVGWKSVILPNGSAVDANPSVGTHTYTIRDGNSNSETQADRVVIRIEGPSKSRVINSILPSVARVGDTITITGTNVASPLGGGVPYCSVQIHDKHRVRHTTLGNPLGAANTQCTWVVNLPPNMPPGNYTLRVGPDLNPNNVSNEVNLTIAP